ncbi:hypothetical protein ACXGQW_08405 [Wenyingzhuangia sp. IMCC45533]
MKKKILLAKHEYSDIYKNITWEFEQNNYEVFHLLFKNYIPKKHKSLKIRLIKLYRKNILKDPNYKYQLISKYYEEIFLILLSQFSENHFDYSLVIRADLYTEKTIQEICRVTNYNIAYHWDGIDRFPDIHTRISYFDKFYVFEKRDLDNYRDLYDNMDITTNFYFEHNKPNKIYEQLDVFYIGAYVQNRWSNIEYICEKLTNYNLTIKVLISEKKTEIANKHKNKHISFLNQLIPYHETLAMSKASNVILDFTIKGDNGHNGYSLRFFEALIHENKVITDNKNVINADFYKSENIFIIDHDDIQNLENFIKSPYQTVSEKIKHKYSFINWFETKLPN